VGVHRHLKSFAAPPGAGTASGAGQSSAILVSGRGPLSALLSRRSQLASARSRSTITTTLPGVPLPDFSDCSPSLIASTVLLLKWDSKEKPREILDELRRYIAGESWGRYKDKKRLCQKVWPVIPRPPPGPKGATNESSFGARTVNGRASPRDRGITSFPARSTPAQDTRRKAASEMGTPRTHTNAGHRPRTAGPAR
jgi:hypothetical protein